MYVPGPFSLPSLYSPSKTAPVQQTQRELYGFVDVPIEEKSNKVLHKNSILNKSNFVENIVAKQIPSYTSRNHCSMPNQGEMQQIGIKRKNTSDKYGNDNIIDLGSDEEPSFQSPTSNIGSNSKRKFITTPKRPLHQQPLRQNQYQMTSVSTKALNFDDVSVESRRSNLNTVVDLKPDVIEFDNESENTIDGSVSSQPLINLPLSDTHSSVPVNSIEESVLNASHNLTTYQLRPIKPADIEKIIDVSSDDENG